MFAFELGMEGGGWEVKPESPPFMGAIRGEHPPLPPRFLKLCIPFPTIWLQLFMSIQWELPYFSEIQERKEMEILHTWLALQSMVRRLWLSKLEELATCVKQGFRHKWLKFDSCLSFYVLRHPSLQSLLPRRSWFVDHKNRDKLEIVAAGSNSEFYILQ